MTSFDFDHWKNLAAASPAEFETARRAALMELVTSAPATQQAGLKALVDTLCAPQAGSPLEKAVHAQNLMLESMAYLQESLGDLVRASGSPAPLVDPVTQFTQLKVIKP